jgi:excinuclease ABC subunit C
LSRFGQPAIIAAMPEKKQGLSVIPDLPGVYFFSAKTGSDPGKKNKIIYIGKAQNLKMRLSSYFQGRADPRKKAMLKESAAVDWQELGSETEALILEAELIKKYRPKYNILMRDDKQYFYVGFTTDEFPKVFLTHQPHKKSEYLGPFTDGGAIKLALKMLRKIFPYCQCSVESKIRHLRPCQQSEIGRCLGVCCLKKEVWQKFYKDAFKRTKKYQKNIKLLKKIISGRRKNVLGLLKKEMENLSQKKRFEEAAEMRNQIQALENIFEHKPYLGRDNQSWNQKGLKYLAELLGIPDISRIEAFDVSNISGRRPTGAMAVFSGGLPDKNEYRRFRIKLPEKPDDPAMIEEIVGRRLRHPEWPLPEVIVIDGGKAQLNAAYAASGALPPADFKNIKIIALAKREEELYLPDGKIIKLKDGPAPLLHLLQLVRNEAHRFALSYHRKLRSQF